MQRHEDGAMKSLPVVDVTSESYAVTRRWIQQNPEASLALLQAHFTCNQVNSIEELFASCYFSYEGEPNTHHIRTDTATYLSNNQAVPNYVVITVMRIQSMSACVPV
jgi:hypothetical protein